MILTIVDHASNHVPDDVDLGIDPALLETHIARDIGALALAEALGFPLIQPGISRLVIDMNRDEDAPGLVPLISDGVSLRNTAQDRADRIVRYYRPYHEKIAARIAAVAPALLVSLHSFTPQLAEKPDERRPWEVGVLYNNDDRAARIAIPLLEASGVFTGDQQPYSGKVLNTTMNRHGEGTGTPYLGIEVRQDLISDPRGVALWASRLLPVIEKCARGVAP
jgi:predicted N-formylglutamate amidohydrolase